MHNTTTKKKHDKKSLESTVAAEAEGVVFLPGRTSRSVIVTMTFAKATVLNDGL